MNNSKSIRIATALVALFGVPTTQSEEVQTLPEVTVTARIRGFEANTVYRDGFRGRFFGNYIQSTAHLERVEVLKGPASVLYGRMEPGGLVNQVSKKPLATPYYSLQQQFGSFDLYRTTLGAAGPLTEDQSLLYRVNFEYLDSGSFRDFVGAETVFVAPVLTWNLSDRTHIALNLQYQHSDRVTDRGLVAIGDPPRIAPSIFAPGGSNIRCYSGPTITLTSLMGRLYSRALARCASNSEAGSFVASRHHTTGTR